MSSHHPSEPSSAASTPRSEHHLPPPPHRWHPNGPNPHQHDGGSGEEEEPAGPRVRLMCSFGGRILPRPHDHQLRYVGGETRIVAVPRAVSFAALLAKLAKLHRGGGGGGGGGGGEAVQVKYQLPQEDLDALISVTSDEDVEIMMEEHERLAAVVGGAAARTPRLRLFLFSTAGGDTGGLGSLHDGCDDPGSRRERWFLDALNSRAGAAATLERGQSEASSVVSELPDYLFGLDNNSDPGEPVHRAPHDRPDPVHRASTFPESPVHRASNEPPEAPIPDLRPVKPKLPGPPAPPPAINQEMPVDEPVQQAPAAGYPGSGAWQYMNEPVPFYFVPASLPQRQAGPVPIPLHVSYGSQPGVNPRPVPVMYQHQLRGFNSMPMAPTPVYVRGLPMAPPGPPVGPYSLPTIMHGPVGGPGVVVSVHPTAGVISREELPDAPEQRAAKYDVNV